MHLGRTALRGSVLALCAAGTLALGVGSASASTLTSAPQAAAISSHHPVDRWHYCNGWHYHGDWRCHGDRWDYCDGWSYHGDWHHGEWRCHGDHWD